MGMKIILLAFLCICRPADVAAQTSNDVATCREFQISVQDFETEAGIEAMKTFMREQLENHHGSVVIQTTIDDLEKSTISPKGPDNGIVTTVANDVVTQNNENTPTIDVATSQIDVTRSSTVAMTENVKSASSFTAEITPSTLSNDVTSDQLWKTTSSTLLDTTTYTYDGTLFSTNGASSTYSNKATDIKDFMSASTTDMTTYHYDITSVNDLISPTSRDVTSTTDLSSSTGVGFTSKSVAPTVSVSETPSFTFPDTTTHPDNAIYTTVDDVTPTDSEITSVTSATSTVAPTDLNGVAQTTLDQTWSTQNKGHVTSRGEKTCIVTDNSTSAAMTSKVSTGASSQTTIASSIAETSTKGSCDITFNGICYWTYVQDESNVNFARAEEICSNEALTPAHFPNRKVYKDVVDNLRSKISFRWSWINVWTGVTIDTNYGNVIHPSGDTYVKWYLDYPWTSYLSIDSSCKRCTHVALYVISDPGDTYQGMFNTSPQKNYDGVVCQSVE